MALSTGLSNPDPTIKLPPPGNLSLDGGAIAPASAAGVGDTARLTPEVGVNYFMSKGLTREQAAGVTQGLMGESGGDPNAFNPAGGNFGAYGLAQDRGPRQQRMLQLYGPTPTVQQQLDYAWHELNTTEKASLYRIRGTTTEGDARQAFIAGFLRPGGPAGPNADVLFNPSPQSWEAAQQVQRAKRDEASSLDQRAKEAIAALDNMRGDQKESMQRIKAAQDAATQSLQATMKAVQSPPRRPELDSLQKFGSLATVVGILGGLLTKSPMRGSLNAAAAAIEAYNSGDQTAYHQAFEQWKTQTDLLAHISDMQSRMLNDIVQDEKMSIEEQRLQFDLRLRALGLHDTANQLRTSAWEDAQNFAQTYDRANFELKKAQQEMIKQANSKWGLASGVDPEGKVIQFEFNPEMPGGGVRDLKTGKPLGFMPTDIQPSGTRSASATKPDIYNAQDPQGKPVQVLYDSNSRAFTDLNHQPLGYTPTNLSRMSAASQMPDPAQVHNVASMIAKYDMAPMSGWAMKSPYGLAVMNEVKAINPNYDATQYAGKQAAASAVGRRGATLMLASNAADQLIPIVEQLSAKVSRFDYPMINAILLAGREKLGDPNVVTFGQSLNSLLYVYMRALNPSGIPRVADLERGQHMLQTAWSDGTLGEVLKLMRQEIGAERTSIQLSVPELGGLFGGDPPPLNPYRTPQDVYGAFDRGEITHDQAKQMLIDNFGLKKQ